MAMLFSAAAALLCLCGASSTDQRHNSQSLASIELLMLNKPLDSDLPTVLAGENFTRENLIKWLTIERVEHHVVPGTDQAHHESNAAQRQKQKFRPVLLEGGEFPVSAGDIVNAGKLAWSIIKDNKPSFDATGDNFATATPPGADWRAMSGWKTATTAQTGTSWVNGFGINVINAKWVARFQYGGEFNGAGQYITNVIGDVIECDVRWPITLDATVKFSAPVNVGSKSNPVAYMEAHVEGDGGTLMIHRTNTWRYEFYGNGAWNFRKLDDVALADEPEVVGHPGDAANSSITPLLCLLLALFVGAAIRAPCAAANPDDQPYLPLSA